jgi:hypothetical protein
MKVEISIDYSGHPRAVTIDGWDIVHLSVSKMP